MAHLARCWCGRKYRCETDHTPPPNILRCFDIEHHDRCPDYILHGPQPGPKFDTIASEKFQTSVVWGPPAESLADIIERNSVKLPPNTVMPWDGEADLEET